MSLVALVQSVRVSLSGYKHVTWVAGGVMLNCVLSTAQSIELTWI